MTARRARIVRSQTIRFVTVVAVSLFAIVTQSENLAAEEQAESIRILVMDPLAAPLSCACVKGTGQRDYMALGRSLAEHLNAKVDVLHEGSLKLAFARFGRNIDVVIGKQSVVEFDARMNRFPVAPLARLTDRAGKTTLRGVFLVRADSPAESVANLSGAEVALGPEEDAESNRAAREALARQTPAVKPRIHVKKSVDEAAYALADGDVEAAVIPDYLPPLLEGCGKVRSGSLKSVGYTDAVPFVTVFVAQSIPAPQRVRLRAALLAVSQDDSLCERLESKSGFVPPEETTTKNEWIRWRGPNGDGTSRWVPSNLPKEFEPVWTADLTGPAMGGIAATQDYVVVPDKNQKLTEDVFRCFSATSGKELWTVAYPAEKNIDYTSAPRAMPIVTGDLVYLQGALGDLLCVKLAGGGVLWRRHIARDFHAEPPNWGYCAPALIDGDRLITNPGAENAALVALNRLTGDTIWTVPGNAAAYSAFQITTSGGTGEIIGYDSASLGGWRRETGKRLWSIVPPDGADFNVGTPLILGNRVLVATENNGTRLYEFDENGLLKPEPIAANPDAAPDTCSPVVIDGRVFVTAYGQLFCLDLNDGLKTLWVQDDDMFYEHTTLIAGNHRLLVFTTIGDLLLIRTDADEYQPVVHLRPFGKAKFESMSHPAIVNGRLYLRSDRKLLAMPIPKTSDAHAASE